MRNLLIFFIILLNNYLIASDPKLASNKRKIDQVTDDNDHKAKKAKLNEESEDDLDHFIDMGSAINNINQDAIKKKNEAILTIVNASDLKSCLAQCENIKDPETESTIRNIIINKYKKQLKDVIKEGLSSGISSNNACISSNGICRDVNIKGLRNYINNVVCDKDANLAMVLCDDGEETFVIDLKNNNNIVFSRFVEGGDLLRPAISPDGKYLANNTDDSLSLLKIDEKFKTFKSFKFEQKEYKTKVDEDDGNEYDSSQEDDFFVFASCFSNCSKFVSGICADGSGNYMQGRIWNVETGERVCKWFKPDENHFIVFSSDNKYILSSNNPGPITFSPDNKYIALIYGQKYASLWNKEDESKIAIDFNDPKTDIIDNNTIAVWDINAKVITKKIKFKQHILSIKFSPDNFFLLVACDRPSYDINDKTGVIYFYNFFTDTLLNFSINPGISRSICLDNSGNKLIMTLDKSLRIIDYSKLWIMNYIDIKNFMFIAKLILNPTDSSLSWKEFIDNFHGLPIQTGIELIQFVLPRLILEHTKIDGNYLDLSKIISQYVGLHDDLCNETFKALAEAIYPKIA